MRLVEGAYSSDGQLQFTLVCDDDGLVVQWEPYGSKLQEFARDNDLTDPSRNRVRRKNRTLTDPSRHRSLALRKRQRTMT